MSAYRPIDSKREEFRKYLERAGVMDALTKILVALYEDAERPDDALEFLRSNLGDKRPAVAEMETLKSELDAANLRIKELEEELHMLRTEDRPYTNDKKERESTSSEQDQVASAPSEL